MLQILGMLFLVDWLFNHGQVTSALLNTASQASTTSTPPQQNAATATPLAQNAAAQPTPWPQSNAGLPPFPSGWQPDDPPPPEVVARANALLAQLWAQGVGSTLQEMTGGRWITYQATWLGSLKGVVAWRVKGATPGASSSPTAATPKGSMPSQATAIQQSEQAFKTASDVFTKYTNPGTSSDAQDAADHAEADGSPSPTTSMSDAFDAISAVTSGDVVELGTSQTRSTSSDDTDAEDESDADQG